MTATTKLAPVGSRPKCKHCGRELRPNFNRPRPPINIPTGETKTYMVLTDFYMGKKEPKTSPVMRCMTPAEKKQWRKEHPAEFLGTYGDYRDNRFCGLRCGYEWAIARCPVPTGMDGRRIKP